MTTDTSPHDFEDELLSHQGFLRRLALQLVRDEHTADDLVQRTLLYALENPPSSQGRLRAWLRTVMRRTATRFLATERRRWEREARAAREEAGDESGEAQLAQDWLESQGVLLEALRSLPESYRSLIYLRYFEGLTPAAIAKRVDEPLETVKTRLRRARERMRERLSRDRKDTIWALALLALPGPPPFLVSTTGTGWAARAAAAIAGGALVSLPFLMDSAPSDSSATPEALVVEVSGMDAPQLAVAELPGRAPIQQVATIAFTPEDGPTAPADSVLCQVITPEGDPVPGLAVAFRPEGTARAHPGIPVGATDAQGFLPVGHLPPGRLTSADPHLRATCAPILESYPTQRDHAMIVAPVSTIASRVVDACGVPVEGVLVKTRHPVTALLSTDVSRSGPWNVSLQTDEEGRFSLTSPMQPDTRVALLLRGYVKQWILATDVPEEIVLERLSGDLHGVAYDPMGSPLEGADVGIGFAVSRTDRSGAFSMWSGAIHRGRFPEGSTGATAERLLAVHPDYAPVSIPVEDLGDAPFEVRFTTPALEIAGRVVDDSGQPVAGVEVWLEDPGFLFTPRSSGEGAGLAYGAEFGVRSASTTDADGAFRLTGLEDRDYHLLAHDRSGKRTGRLGPVPSGTQVATLVMKPHEITVAGRVVGPGGEPIPAALVRFVLDLQAPVGVAEGVGLRWRVVEEALCDAGGRFELDVPAGSYPLVTGEALWSRLFREDSVVRARMAAPQEGRVELDLVVRRSRLVDVHLSDADLGDVLTVHAAGSVEALPVRRRQGLLVLLGDAGLESKLLEIGEISGPFVVPEHATKLLLWRKGELVSSAALHFGDRESDPLVVQF